MRMRDLTPHEVAHVARGAADVIDTYGWHQGDVGNKVVGFCAIGAIHHANTFGITEGCMAVDAFGDWMAESGFLSRQRGLVEWNDKDCTTPEEVTLHLRKFADEIDPRRES